jgi:predicted DNA-binding helix-hairpin-helix protein
MEWTYSAVKATIRGSLRRGIVGANDTQFVVGATSEPDSEIISTIGRFMDNYGLRRPFFMSFDPVPDTPLSGVKASPLWREVRLYQTSYLLKDYGLKPRELETVLDDHGFLPDDDPKLVLARMNRDEFPVDVNLSTYKELIRVPGIGPRTANRIIRCGQCWAMPNLHLWVPYQTRRPHRGRQLPPDRPRGVRLIIGYRRDVEDVSGSHRAET